LNAKRHQVLEAFEEAFGVNDRFGCVGSGHTQILLVILSGVAVRGANATQSKDPMLRRDLLRPCRAFSPEARPERLAMRVLILADMRSFDSTTASLREAVAALRMTTWKRLRGGLLHPA